MRFVGYGDIFDQSQKACLFFVQLVSTILYTVRKANENALFLESL